MEKKLQAATKALIFYDEKVLILRESSKYKEGTNAGRYDVPGGRIKPGQRFDKSLLREINEETGLMAKIGRPFYVDEWHPEIKGEKIQIVGIFFECFANSKKVRLSRDHDIFQWINPVDYKQFDLLPGLEKVFESYLKIHKV